ncbi:MarR family winged helix-turn-helix transcriptional regulator [Sphingosinicella terrae]|uniref:MarR family winged helix-turn-helix transcriptional regulator n=1 Tax=Sphingosinicella terrae TaxID=2172047 RepID=UPI000E0CD15D|nr:MarR family transcriptional regulator [Sphingosinicella terrae]
MNESLSLGHRLRQLLAALDGDVQSLYDELGIAFRPRFFPIVRRLLAASPQRVGDLAAAIGVSQPAATQTIAEMARAGLVSLAPAADRRTRQVALTPEGERLAERLGPVWAAVEAAAAALDRELDRPLSAAIDQALAALGREPFRDRIRKALK